MHVYKSNRVEKLIGPLARELRKPSGDPFAPEVVVVHSKGMERWLAMQIGQQLGICANVRFPFPGRIVQEAFAAALGDRARSLDAWRPESLLWTILGCLPGLHDRPGFEPLDSYLDDDPAGLKRFQLAQRIARTFDRYATYRPDLVLDWERGVDTGGGWQPELWRAVAERIDGGHLARLWRPFQDAMTRGDAPLEGFPSRLFLFGVSTLPPLYMDVLARLARKTEVHLFQLAPSREWWAHVRTRRQIARAEAGLFGAVDPTDLHLEVGHPLLASLGRLGRDFQLILEDAEYDEPAGDLFEQPLRDDLLQGLQRDMLDLRVEARPIDDPDRSIEVHSCHGELRQVQVLQDRLLQLFKDLPSLQPRDIAVMMPDVEHWAPLVKAVFDRDDDDPRHIPFRVSDRSLRRDNPVAEGLIALMGLVDSRVTASQVLDLLSHEPIRLRYELGADDVEAVTAWVRESGIRWGIDADHRARVGVPAEAQNTWRFGLDRLLLGIAMRGNDERLFQGVLPYDEVEGNSTRVLGRFIDLCERLFEHLEDLTEPRSLAAWNLAIDRLLTDFLVDDHEHAWQHQQVRSVLADAVARAQGVRFDEAITPEVLLGFLSSVFEESMPASGYLSGQVTFCAMVPMRSIPFRVVCMLGMDERAYPRRGRHLDFDRVDGSRKGDRTPREDDRTLFLEALLSARDRLIVTYTGQDIRDNKPTPPSVMVSELLDALESTRGDIRSRVTIDHPLQPFSPANFRAGDERRFSFDDAYLEGARRLRSEREGLPAWLAEPLPPLEAPAEITLDDLYGFFGSGSLVRLMNRRLKVWFGRDEDAIEDREPFDLNALELWGLGSALLDKAVRVDDGSVDTFAEAVRAKGALPHGVPGDCVFETRIKPLVEPLAARIREQLGEHPRPAVRVDLVLSGVRVTGSVDGWTEKGRLLYSYSKLKAKHQLRAWIGHLASSVVEPGIGATRLFGRRAGGGVAAYDYRTLDPNWARERLADLVALYRMGQSRPLPFFPETCLAWAEARAANDWGPPPAKATWRAKDKWSTRWDSGEGDDSHVRRALGDIGFTPELSFGGGPDLSQLAERVYRPMINLREEG